MLTSMHIQGIEPVGPGWASCEYGGPENLGNTGMVTISGQGVWHYQKAIVADAIEGGHGEFTHIVVNPRLDSSGTAELVGNSLNRLWFSDDPVDWVSPGNDDIRHSPTTRSTYARLVPWLVPGGASVTAHFAIL